MHFYPTAADRAVRQPCLPHNWVLQKGIQPFPPSHAQTGCAYLATDLSIVLPKYSEDQSLLKLTRIRRSPIGTNRLLRLCCAIVNKGGWTIIDNTAEVCTHIKALIVVVKIPMLKLMEFVLPSDAATATLETYLH